MTRPHDLRVRASMAESQRFRDETKARKLVSVRRMLGDGLTLAEIARALCVSTDTVRAVRDEVRA